MSDRRPQTTREMLQHPAVLKPVEDPRVKATILESGDDDLHQLWIRSIEDPYPSSGMRKVYYDIVGRNRLIDPPGPPFQIRGRIVGR